MTKPCGMRVAAVRTGPVKLYFAWMNALRLLAEPRRFSDAGLRSLARLARLQLRENATGVLGLIRGVSPSDWNRTYAISLETRRR
jgi:hypothetical protein